jgi:hypothetical protein
MINYPKKNRRDSSNSRSRDSRGFENVVRQHDQDTVFMDEQLVM